MCVIILGPIVDVTSDVILSCCCFFPSAHAELIPSGPGTSVSAPTEGAERYEFTAHFLCRVTQAEKHWAGCAEGLLRLTWKVLPFGFNWTAVGNDELVVITRHFGKQR